jgi:hypothetical protein
MKPENPISQDWRARSASGKVLPFEPLAPNIETVEAMKAARSGELVKAGKPDKLLASLKKRRAQTAVAAIKQAHRRRSVP